LQRRREHDEVAENDPTEEQHGTIRSSGRAILRSRALNAGTTNAYAW